MIRIIDHHLAPENRALLQSMFADRKRLFVDLFGWDIPVVDGAYEIDQFDTADTIYAIAVDDSGKHEASLRLFPSELPHMLDTLFPHLCPFGVPVRRARRRDHVGDDPALTENTYDSATGRLLLVPQGARLVGSYDSVVAFGQKRALIVWQRIIMPDGSSLRIDNVPATDPSGYDGLADKVDFHTWQLLKGVVLSTLLGVSSELALSGQSDFVQAIRMSTQDNVARAADQITQRNLGIQPTITIRPGAPVRLIVHKDLVLMPPSGGSN